MIKKEVQQRVLQNGKPLDFDKFSWDENTKTFLTTESNLVIDFFGMQNCTFKTGSSCTFKTGSSCTFDTGSSCTFKTSSSCTFKTSSYCTFDTLSYCIFKTSSSCTFKTGSSCTFDTGSSCTFKTSSYCTFDTLSYCTFKTGSSCVLVRRDVFEFFEIPVGITIKLNGYQAKGYSVIEELKEFQVTRTVKAKTQEEAERLVTTKQDNN
jgi:hypothetical protein